MAIIAYFSGAIVLEVTTFSDLLSTGGLLIELLLVIPAIIGVGAGIWWYILPEWLRAEDSKNRSVFSEKTLILLGFVLWVAATLGVVSFYNIAQGAFQLGLPYLQSPYLSGVSSFAGLLSAGVGAVLSRRRFVEPAFTARRNEAPTTIPWTQGRHLRGLGWAMIFFGVYLGVLGTYLAYPALILLVGGVIAYILGRLLERRSRPKPQ